MPEPEKKKPWKFEWDETNPLHRTLKMRFESKEIEPTIKHIHPMPEYDFEKEVLLPFVKRAKDMGFEMFLYKPEEKVVQIAKGKIRSYKFTDDSETPKEQFDTLVDKLGAALYFHKPAINEATKEFLDEVNASPSMRALKRFLVQDKDGSINRWTYQEAQDSFESLITSDVFKNAIEDRLAVKAIVENAFVGYKGNFKQYKTTAIEFSQRGDSVIVNATWPNSEVKDLIPERFTKFVNAFDISEPTNNIFLYLKPEKHEEVIKEIKRHIPNEYFTKEGFDLYAKMNRRRNIVPDGMEKTFYHRLMRFFAELTQKLPERYAVAMQASSVAFLFNVCDEENEDEEKRYVVYFDINDVLIHQKGGTEIIIERVQKAIKGIEKLLGEYLTYGEVGYINNMLKNYHLEIFKMEWEP